VELSSREPPDMNKLMPVVVQSLVEMKIIRRAEDIAFVRPRLMDHAYVVFDHEYYSTLEQIQSFLLEHRIHSCGRYGGWDYSSMEDALISGRKAAQKTQEIIK
jgi:protoporphyrinogen oxidase